MRSTLLGIEGTKTFAIVMDVGDEVVTGLEQWATAEQLAGATLTAIGGFQSAVLGFFDWEAKDYRRIPIDEQTEVVSLLGDIATGGDGRKLHAHAIVSLADGTTRAGHLLHGVVRPTLEVIVTEAPAHLQRRSDPATGLALLDLG